MGPSLRDRRIKLNLQASDVADAMGVSATFVCLLEQGKAYMSANMVNRYMSALQLVKTKQHEPKH